MRRIVATAAPPPTPLLLRASKCAEIGKVFTRQHAALPVETNVRRDSPHLSKEPRIGASTPNLPISCGILRRIWQGRTTTHWRNDYVLGGRRSAAPVPEQR